MIAGTPRCCTECGRPFKPTTHNQVACGPVCSEDRVRTQERERQRIMRQNPAYRAAQARYHRERRAADPLHKLRRWEDDHPGYAAESMRRSRARRRAGKEKAPMA